MTESAPRRAALRPEMANEIRILNGMANERTNERQRWIESESAHDFVAHRPTEMNEVAIVIF